jgi:alpha-glucosidase
MRGRVLEKWLGALLTLLLPLLASALEVSSPDRRIVFGIDTDSEGVPTYDIRFDDESVIGKSQLGLRFASQAEFDTGLRISGTSRSSQDTIWEQPWGERRLIRDQYNELLVRLTSVDEPERRFNLRVRVHNDGVGFRYEVPEQEYFDELNIIDELTEFHLPADAQVFWQPGSHRDKYEVLYVVTSPADIDNAHSPVTLRLPSGVHISIHEAALTDYSAFTLENTRNSVLRTDLRPGFDGIAVRTRAPFHSPWRTIQISPDAKGLLNSNLILNLNESNILGDVSWVEPGKYVGIWWTIHLGQRTWRSGSQHGATTEETRRYIDFAADHGFDGVLLEGWNVGWGEDEDFSYTKATPDLDLPAVARYARKSGVRLVGHHETFGNVPEYEIQMADAFDLYESLGVRQVKTGYVGRAGSLQRVDANGETRSEWHDGQFAIDHQLRVLREAAKRKISINTHEPVKDTGLRRTYPNWLSREGARGQEFAVWGEVLNPPEHTVLLPYTRLLGGPMDFTPGIFDLEFEINGNERRVQTTLAKQLALYVVLYSPIQMVPDLPENYEHYPDAFQFIIDVPTDWEESVAIAGEVGDYVVFARKERDGEDWYLGAISDEASRALSVPLSFLSEGCNYIATIYRDGERADWQSTPYDYVIEEREFDRDQMLELKLAAGGGTAIRFRPIPEAGQCDENHS